MFVLAWLGMGLGGADDVANFCGAAAGMGNGCLALQLVPSDAIFLGFVSRRIRV